jgi:hypothetical protein
MPESATWWWTVPDYSEFPTTPTGWQERAWQDFAPAEMGPAEIEPATPPTRRPDLVALVPGVAFIVLAIGMMAGVSVPFLFRDGGILWLVLIGAGVALLVSELRRARIRR